MTSKEIPLNAHDIVYEALVANHFGPYFVTPCGILAPLLQKLEAKAEYYMVAREDNAMAQAAGAALGGRSPVVLMQNSGFGQSVNAIASLIVPYQIPILLIISMRGIRADSTPENAVMGRITSEILDCIALHWQMLTPGREREQIEDARDVIRLAKRPTALLVAPDIFNWKP